jgi:hypothetical protein
LEWNIVIDVQQNLEEGPEEASKTKEGRFTSVLEERGFCPRKTVSGIINLVKNPFFI